MIVKLMPEGAFRFNPPRHYFLYVEEFTQATKDQDTTAILDLLHPDYVKEQHDENLEGRTEQFLEEFYGCRFEQMEDYGCGGYYWLNGKPYGIFYTILSKDEFVRHDWTFVKREGYKYKVALWGAVG